MAVASTPMAHSVHVLISGVLVVKLSVTGMAFELGFPVSSIVHVLVCRLPIVE